VERLHRFYTPAVMGLAFFIFLLPPIVLGKHGMNGSIAH
jgi:hypothetical protein